MSMSIDGLISGMDTTSLIAQLIQAESAPKTALTARLAETRNAASAYRTLNVTFAAVRAAAEKALKVENWSATKASTSADSVTVTAGATAAPGSLSFTVEKTAKAHVVLNRNTGSWTSADSAYGASSITVLEADGATAKTPAITIADANSDGTLSLTEAAAAINADTEHGLTASVVRLSSTEFALQVSSRETGLASRFGLSGAGTFTAPTVGQDAELKVGDSAEAYRVSSATNTFASLMPGATITVSRPESSPVTVTIAADPEAVATTMQTLVDAVNATLAEVRRATDNSKGSTATLKGDYTVSQLAGQLLDAVSSAIAGAGAAPNADRSPASVGFELSKDGKSVVFTKATFLTALEGDPGLAQRMVAGRDAGTDAEGNPVTAVTGLAERLLQVAENASDSTRGFLVKLAESKESSLDGIQDRIDAWDLRLAKRKEMLTRQFTAMETALSALRNQSTWLAGQINSLPSYG